YGRRARATRRPTPVDRGALPLARRLSRARARRRTGARGRASHARGRRRRGRRARRPRLGSHRGGSMKDLVVTHDRGHVRTIVLNRPDKMNALSHALAWAIVTEVQKAAHDDDVWAIALTGN